jgi:nucleoside-diphosphate-sugar epimerase
VSQWTRESTGGGVLVTGGAGFIGSYVVDRLLQDKVPVTVLDLAPPRARATSALRQIRGDVRDRATLDAALEGVGTVFHLAAAHHDSGLARDTYFSVNEGGAATLCDAMGEAGVRTLCFYSTAAVYGAAPEPRHEDGPTLPASPYGQSKLAAERIFESWSCCEAGRYTLVIRPSVTFGPGNFANMFALIRLIDSGRYVQVGSGSNVKSLSYVENLVDATFWLWQRRAPSGFDVYNCVDKPDLTSREIAGVLAEALGREPARLTVPLWLGLALGFPFDVARTITGRGSVSTDRIRKLAVHETRFPSDRLHRAGFAPRVSLREGLARMVRWYIAEGRAAPALPSLPPLEVVRLERHSMTRAG